MAKKKKNKSTQSGEKSNLIKFCAFWGLAIAAILFVVTAILNVLGNWIEVNGTLINVFDILAKVALLIAIGIPAYSYVRGRGKKWKVFYWIAFLIYALGVVFSVLGAVFSVINL